ncbi:hypothetical protein [Microbacterium paludicola]|uniref:hypothetical protein n=1 Tax=Microbacterium paludicola TaxID=300019 RepID=UPI0031D83AFE
MRFQTPQEVVAVTLRALQRRDPPISVVSGGRNRFIRRLMSVLPKLVVLRLAHSRPAQV